MDQEQIERKQGTRNVLRAVGYLLAGMRQARKEMARLHINPRTEDTADAHFIVRRELDALMEIDQLVCAIINSPLYRYDPYLRMLAVSERIDREIQVCNDLIASGSPSPEFPIPAQFRLQHLLSLRVMVNTEV